MTNHIGEANEMIPMTQQRLDEIRARCEAATLGPWRGVDKGNTVPSHAVKTVAFDGSPSVGVCCGISPKTGNADFIAHSRQDIPDLLQEVERLRSKVISAVETMITVQDYIDSAECRDDLNGINEYIDEWIGRKEG